MYLRHVGESTDGVSGQPVEPPPPVMQMPGKFVRWHGLAACSGETVVEPDAWLEQSQAELLGAQPPNRVFDDRPVDPQQVRDPGVGRGPGNGGEIPEVVAEVWSGQTLVVDKGETDEGQDVEFGVEGGRCRPFRLDSECQAAPMACSSDLR